MRHVFAGTKVEGILRQAADVEEVDRRVQEYEQGTNSFVKCHKHYETYMQMP